LASLRNLSDYTWNMANFSQTLQVFLSSKKPKTLQDLIDNFAEKSFAILFLLLMAIPALPLPTGGVTHVFEIIVMLLSLELIAGRKTVWLPKQWTNKKLPNKLQTSALPKLLRSVRWVEGHSKPRLSRLLVNVVSTRILALTILFFTIFAFLAPPFSGLDTLPSLGVVIIALAIIFEDFLLTVIGIAVGIAGIGLVLLLGQLVIQVL